jgi:hypothetical protein
MLPDVETRSVFVENPPPHSSFLYCYPLGVGSDQNDLRAMGNAGFFNKVGP